MRRRYSTTKLMIMIILFGVLDITSYFLFNPITTVLIGVIWIASIVVFYVGGQKESSEQGERTEIRVGHVGQKVSKKGSIIRLLWAFSVFISMFIVLNIVHLFVTINVEIGVIIWMLIASFWFMGEENIRRRYCESVEF